MDEHKELMTDINRLLSLSEEELYSEIGQEFSARQAIPLHPRELVDRGRRLFNAQLQEIQDSICKSDKIKIFTTQSRDNTDIVLEIIRVLERLILPISTITLGVLLVKKGLKTVCTDYWTG